MGLTSPPTRESVRMARTKQMVLDDRSAKQKAADRRRRRAGIAKAACILSTQELDALPPVKQPAHARAPSETEDDSAAEEEEITAAQVRHSHPPDVLLYLRLPCSHAWLVQALSQGSRSASAAPAASGYAYGSRRRSAAAEEAQVLEEDGWADEARGIFREREGRRALVDGNARSCGQDGLVAVATLLGLKASKDAVRAATLPPEGDTPIGTIRAYASDTLGIDMCSLKDHSILGFSPWERPGGAEHQLLLLDEGVYYTELKITMPKMVTTEKARVSRRHC
jgi:hypothetical protein